MVQDLAKKYNFIKEVQKLKNIERANKAIISRKENDAEHSWSTTLICWMFLKDFEKEFNKKIDVEKLLKMSLIHDIVKIYCGDTSVWDKYNLSSEEQLENEKKVGKEILFSILPDKLGDEACQIWNECHSLSTLESKIEKGVERISPAIQRLITGQGWLGEKARVDDLDKIQLIRIGFSKTLKQVYEMVKKEGIEKRMIFA